MVICCGRSQSSFTGKLFSTAFAFLHFLQIVCTHPMRKTHWRVQLHRTHEGFLRRKMALLIPCNPQNQLRKKTNWKSPASWRIRNRSWRLWTQDRVKAQNVGHFSGTPPSPYMAKVIFWIFTHILSCVYVCLLTVLSPPRTCFEVTHIELHWLQWMGQGGHHSNWTHRALNPGW